MITLHYSPFTFRRKTRLENQKIAFFDLKKVTLLNAFVFLCAANCPPVLAQAQPPSPVTAPAAASVGGAVSGATSPSAPGMGSGSAVPTSIASAAMQARRAARTPVTGDYVAALAGLALVLSAKRSPASNAIKANEGDQQFSVISPFPGGGFSVRPDGDLRPGGAMQVNIPLAYTPTRLAGVASVDVAQNRSYQNLNTENGRNGTANFAIGFPVARRGVWFSRMFLSASSFTQGGDRAYCALVQLAPETRSVPAIAVGVQDLTNSRIRSPFIVATKQLGEQPVFATFGLGRGRFSGSDVFGGVSYAPVERVSLSAEYDGLQINLGAGFALSRKLSLLASYNDLAANSHRPAGRLGARYQFGANLTF